MNFLYGFRNLSFWSEVSFGSPHENEYRFFQYGSSPVVLVMSLDCAWAVGSCTWFHGWHSDFRYSSKGSMYFVKEDTFMSSYVYIQAMLLIRGIQFSTDHWNDPFLSTVCACLFFPYQSVLENFRKIHGFKVWVLWFPWWLSFVTLYEIQSKPPPLGLGVIGFRTVHDLLVGRRAARTLRRGRTCANAVSDIDGSFVGALASKIKDMFGSNGKSVWLAALSIITYVPCGIGMSASFHFKNVWNVGKNKNPPFKKLGWIRRWGKLHSKSIVSCWNLSIWS